MTQHHEPEGLDQYLTVSEAAALLGVSASTLRNWDRTGKLSAKRHPINSYRLYHRKDLEAVLNRLHHRQESAKLLHKAKGKRR